MTYLKNFISARCSSCSAAFMYHRLDEKAARFNLCLECELAYIARLSQMGAELRALEEAL